MKRIRNFRLIDDDFLTVVFCDLKCAELLLQIILDKDDLQAISVTTQKNLKNLQGHSVVLDVYAKDSLNNEYDIEIQRADGGAVPRRARYNSSIIDANILERGTDYEKLHDVYVIFITEKDVLGDNQPIYHIERTIRENSTNFNDGSHIIYVNGEIKDETRLGQLIHDFYCTKSDDMNYNVLAERVRYYKENKEGVVSMCRAMEEMRNEAARKAEQELRISTVKKLLAIGKLTYEEIALSFDMTVEEVKALDSKYIA